MTWSNGGNCNIHATVGPITWKPHYRSVEYQSWFNVLSITGGECKRWAMCLSKDLNETFRRHHSRCACAPHLLRTKASQNLAFIWEEIVCIGITDLHASWQNANLASRLKVVLWAFVTYISKLGVLFFSRPKIEPFLALLFLVFGCVAENACNMRGNNREPLS